MTHVSPTPLPTTDSSPTPASAAYDLIVIGAGPSGMMAAITAARAGRRVLILEAKPQCGLKINASGGGRCNISNTQSADIIMGRYGRYGRFMEPALRDFDGSSVVAFFAEIGVQCHAPDGFHYWPITHKATTVTNALLDELQRLDVTIQCSVCVKNIETTETDNGKGRVTAVRTSTDLYPCTHVLLATGGLGFPKISGSDSGHTLSQALGHTITSRHPGMQPLYCRDLWVAQCTAHTIPKVTLSVDIKKHKKLSATGALIFTSNGIAGPVVKDFAREITPLVEKYDTVPLRANLVQGRHSEECFSILKKKYAQLRSQTEHPPTSLDVFQALAPEPIINAATSCLNIQLAAQYSHISGADKDALVRWLIACPLTITGSSGFKLAMVTRGGVSLKQIDPHTLMSKSLTGLYFCGETIDLDGPCGGFNLTWAWASGRLAGMLLE